MAKILLVDDDPKILEAYEALLRSAHHRTTRAVDGSEAILKITREKYDLIITDLNMPRANRSGFVEQLLSIQLNSKTPVIICSGYISNKTIESLVDVPRVHFLPKPITPKVFLQTIDAALAIPPPRPKLDVRFVNPILESSIELLTEQGFKISKIGSPYLKKAEEISGDLSVLVGIVGPGFKGSLSLSFTTAAYIHLLHKAFELPATEINGENREGIVQLLKIIFEKAKPALTLIDLSIEMTSPSVLDGKGHRVDHSKDFQTLVLTIGFEESFNFRVEICAHG